MIKYYDKYGNELFAKDFIELSWNRSWGGIGSFTYYLPANQYDPDIKYIHLETSDEWAIVQKIVYSQKTEGDFVTLEGMLLEGVLNFGSCWTDYSYEGGNSSEVRTEIRRWIANSFNLSVAMTGLSGYRAPAAVFAKPQLYKIQMDSSSTYPEEMDLFVEGGVQFGDSILAWLADVGYSLKCSPIWNSAAKESKEPLLGVKIKIIKGHDLSNEVYFGKSFDNVSQVQYSLDESAEKSVYIAVNEVSVDDKSNFTNVQTVSTSNGKKYYITEDFTNSDYRTNTPKNLGYCWPGKILKTSVTTHEVSNAKARKQMDSKSRLDMRNNFKVETTVVDVIQNTFYYLEDYDLGDICTVVIDELKLMYNARIIEVHETFSSNKREVSITLGSLKKKKYEVIKI